VLYDLARPFIFTLDPETAHHVAFANLRRAHALGLTRLLRPHVADDPVEVMGLAFPNPVGLAAGLDKNAEHIDALADFGFGFIEVGTVTPRPQPGNPAPRLFRLPKAAALINRMGFNNEGLDRFVANVQASARTPTRRSNGRSTTTWPGCAASIRCCSSGPATWPSTSPRRTPATCARCRVAPR
jgi:dihydroorotate dehydrogenase